MYLEIQLLAGLPERSRETRDFELRETGQKLDFEVHQNRGIRWWGVANSEMADFGRFPGFRISDPPPTYSPVFDVPRNPTFGRSPGARNREFRDYVPAFRCTWESWFCEASRSSKSRLPR